MIGRILIKSSIHHHKQIRTREPETDRERERERGREGEQLGVRRLIESGDGERLRERNEGLDETNNQLMQQ